jgi:hypothetical protein
MAKKLSEYSINQKILGASYENFFEPSLRRGQKNLLYLREHPVFQHTWNPHHLLNRYNSSWSIT